MIPTESASQNFENNETVDQSLNKSPESENQLTARKAREQVEDSIEKSIKSINDALFNLLLGKNDLLYTIKNKIKNIPQKETQMFSICWIIAWETEKYFRIRNRSFYEKLLKPVLNAYTYYVNTAKQKLDTAKFCEFYSDLVEKIEKSQTEKPQPVNRFIPDSWEKRNFFKPIA